MFPLLWVLTLSLDSPHFIAPVRTTKKTSLPLLRVLSLPGKVCPESCSLATAVVLRLYTQLLLGNGSTCHNTYAAMAIPDCVVKMINLAQSFLHTQREINNFVMSN
jgi:hypothetical protein